MVGAARRAVGELDPNLAVAQVQGLSDVVSDAMSTERLVATLLTVFAGVGLLLAVIGLYGVVSYAVATKSREVGIRMALGADPQEVVGTLTKGGLRLVGVGTVIGLFVAFALAQLLGSLLYGVPSTDPVSFLGVPALLAAVSFLAAWIPARRASLINPVQAMKAD